MAKDTEESPLQNRIAECMKEVEQLHQRPTLDDFQEYWRRRLESDLLAMRQELRKVESVAENLKHSF